MPALEFIARIKQLEDELQSLKAERDFVKNNANEMMKNKFRHLEQERDHYKALYEEAKNEADFNEGF